MGQTPKDQVVGMRVEVPKDPNKVLQNKKLERSWGLGKKHVLVGEQLSKTTLESTLTSWVERQ